MKMQNVCRSRWENLGYVFLMCPATLAAACVLNFTPMLRRAFQQQLAGAALPYLTQVMIDTGPHLLASPVIVLFLGVASLRFRFLNHPIVVGFVGSVLASFYLLYWMSMALPMITITTGLGGAGIHR